MRRGVNYSELNEFFTGIGSQINQAQSNNARNAACPSVNASTLDRFFSAISRQSELAEVKQRLLNQREATAFNVFDFIEPDENKLSDVLAMLLDPKGDHGQGDLFLRLLFKQLGIHRDTRDTTGAIVRREATTHGIIKHRRRMDVLIDAGALVAIENKIDSLEQPKQVEDYLEHLLQSARGRLSLNCLIYLTPNGRHPESLSAVRLKQELTDGRLHCWSYHRELRAWLENCRRDCAARRIQDFLSDFMTYADVELKREAMSNLEAETDEE